MNCSRTVFLQQQPVQKLRNNTDCALCNPKFYFRDDKNRIITYNDVADGLKKVTQELDR